MRGLARPHVVVFGLDLSIIATGLIAIPSDWEGDWSRCVTLHVEPDLPAKTLVEKMDRIQHVVDAAVGFVIGNAHRGTRVRIAIENYAYNRFNGVRLAEVGGPVKLDLHRRGYVVEPVIMQTARKLLCGKVPAAKNRRGMAEKEYVRTRATAMGMPAPWSMDVGDAFVTANQLLADYGAALIGEAEPAEKKPKQEKRR